ncbi:DUF1534 domain-containing protein [Pseudomonas savastanoi]|nr:DUF1534 domain-containing protein [Pseudomonas savastanoi]
MRSTRSRADARCSTGRLSFLTLQRGNALGNAPRRILKSGRGAP